MSIYSIKNLTFKYPLKEENALKEINLDIKKASHF